MTPDEERIICIYHGNCADGFGAAWVVNKFYKELQIPVEFVAGVYGKPPPDVKDKNVILVDFSYKRPVMEQLIMESASLLVLDHHKTARDDLDGLEHGWEEGHEVKIIFDMTKSGALLAWEFYYPGKPVLDLIQHISDRDLWQFKLPGTREIQANLFSFPYNFEVWDELMREDVQGLREEGAAIERKHFKDINELLAVTKRSLLIGNFCVPAANLPYTFSSDAGHIMSLAHPDAHFAACYWDIPDHKVVFSLRSRPEGGDVSEIAKMYGGGGHKNAAGFTVTREYMRENFEAHNDKIEEAKPANAANGGSNT